MYQPSKWWLGLTLPVILWGTANVLSDERIEQDLTFKTITDYPWVKPTFAGRDATLSGIAPNEEVKAKAVAAIESIRGVRRVTASALEVLAEVKPYKWLAVRDGNKLTLNGYYPDETTHQTILATAKKFLPNAQLMDEMKLARGVPAGFEAATAFGLSQLGNLSTATVTLEDLKYSITGAAPTSAIYTSELAKVKALPQGVILMISAISPPVQKPYSWAALREGNLITLNGFVPSEVIRLKNIEAVKTAMPGASIIDKQDIAAGEPAGFEQMAGYAIAQMAKLLKGSVQLEDKVYSLAGEASSVQLSDAALAATKMLPVGYTLGKAAVSVQTPIPAPILAPMPASMPVPTPLPVEALPPVAPLGTADPVAGAPDIILKQADICRSEFTQELKESSIYFDTDKDTIRQVSFATLDRLVEIAKRCPRVQVEIGAHTDSDGAPAYNQDLSERRAKAVLDYMKLHVDTAKYTAAGYGETKPIASNETDEGKQKNRRVEFIVK